MSDEKKYRIAMHGEAVITGMKCTECGEQESEIEITQCEGCKRFFCDGCIYWCSSDFDETQCGYFCMECSE